MAGPLRAGWDKETAGRVVQPPCTRIFCFPAGNERSVVLKKKQARSHVFAGLFEEGSGLEVSARASGAEVRHITHSQWHFLRVFWRTLPTILSMLLRNVISLPAQSSRSFILGRFFPALRIFHFLLGNKRPLCKGAAEFDRRSHSRPL